MKSRLFRSTLCAVLAAAALAVSAMAAEVGSATITGSSVRLRAGASTQTEILAVTRQNATVTTLGREDNWYKVIYCGKMGYMSADYLAPVAGAEVTAAVKGTDVRLRTGPGTNYDIADVYHTGQPLVVLEALDGWYKVRTEDREGYICADYVSFTPVAADASEMAQAIVDTALSYLGVPYVYGGSTPDGFDCSGFVQYVFKQYDISLNRTAYDQYYGVGEDVAYEDLVPGDVVFFTNTWLSGIGHVGIYIGDGQFVHATSGSAYSVAIGDLGSANYTARYVGAKRIV